MGGPPADRHRLCRRLTAYPGRSFCLEVLCFLREKRRAGRLAQRLPGDSCGPATIGGGAGERHRALP